MRWRWRWAGWLSGGLVLISLLLLWAVSARTMANYTAPDGPIFTGNFAGSPPPVPSQIRVVSWNIRFGEEVATAVAEIRRNPNLANADILLLQEMDEAGVARLAQALAYNYVYIPASVHSHHGRNFGNAVLAKWPISQPEKLLLPFTNPSNGQRRIAAKAVVNVGDLPLTVYSVHTETYWLRSLGRRAQATAVVQDISVGQSPVIVGGDFNTISKADGARLAGQFAGVGLARAQTPPTVSIAGIEVTADHLFARSLAVAAAGGAETAASDHAPVWVTFSLID
ncbi:MAG: endonuclease/exonuclease/phosphatase family protein [Chloroflexi bacterium]|nr:endonuclease/exonuclease/phosphatase family protein [Chloroflexota bacterium]MBP7042920.1 endonuclease/exonuclease/phosphatase family protein [Chloroflexota bacterium]